MAAPDHYIPSTSAYDIDYREVRDPPVAPQQQIHLNNTIVVVALIIFFSSIFLITILHIYVKWAWRSYHRNSPGLHFLHQSRADPGSHIPGGLSKDAIMQLPTFVYKALPAAGSNNNDAGSENAGALECTVCLSDFEEGESGRLLPSCRHSFHIECIDMWFFSHSTCPLCRAVVMPTISTPPLMPLPVSSHHQLQGAEELALHEAETLMEATPSSLESHSPDMTVIAAGDNAGNAMVIPVPTNALFCSDTIQSIPSHSISSKSSGQKPSSSYRATRCMPHITIEIPTRLDISLTSPSCISASSSRRSRSAPPHEPACSSIKSIKSPGLRESVKRMLSMASNKEKRAFTSSSQDGNMESPR